MGLHLPAALPTCSPGYMTGVMELAMLRLLSKHLTPSGPNHQQQLRQLNGNHKMIYLGKVTAHDLCPLQAPLCLLGCAEP